jgi:hypothetical protein
LLDSTADSISSERGLELVKRVLGCIDFFIDKHILSRTIESSQLTGGMQARRECQLFEHSTLIQHYRK